MEKEKCTTCGKSKALLSCGVCTVSVCKHCAQILEEESFSFLDVQKPEMLQTTFCNTCFDEKIAPDLMDYQQTMEAAKNIEVFFKDQGKETRLMKRIDVVFSIVDCPDRNEAIMRLAFKAVKMGFNSVIDVDIVAKKVKMGAYQTHSYKATGVPSNVRPENVVHDRSIWQSRN
jgi:hypothetical protein